MYNESNSVKEEKLEKIKAGVMPYGKYKDTSIKSVPGSYVRYLVDQNQGQNISQVNKLLLKAFEDSHPAAFLPLPPVNNNFLPWQVGKTVTFKSTISAKFSYEGRHGLVSVTKFIKDTGEVIVHAGKRPEALNAASVGAEVKLTAIVKGFHHYEEQEKQNLIKNLKNIDFSV
jgi:uncharacterized protein (DUF3820 family)